MTAALTPIPGEPRTPPGWRIVVIEPAADHDPTLDGSTLDDPAEETGTEDRTAVYVPDLPIPADCLYVEEDGTPFYDCPDCGGRFPASEARIDDRPERYRPKIHKGARYWSCRKCIEYEMDSPETQECRACGGTGVYEHRPCDDHYIERLACSDCDGTGRVPVEAGE
jgi:hypothetical protein